MSDASTSVNRTVGLPFAVIYCRVSTKDQVQNLSLETQEKACLDYCERNGYRVHEVYVERGESAKTADRTELKKLLASCRQKKGQIQAVVVYAVSRFARDRYDHVVLRTQLASLGITLRSVTEPIDDSPAGKLMEGIVASMAQFDNDVRSERTVAGMKARLERGGWTFRAPLGLQNGLDADGEKILLPDPQRAPLVTKALELFATGLYSKRQVLDIVTRLGLRTKAGKRLSPQTFCQLLRKPIYAGVREVRVWGVCQQSNAAALISIETFNRIQDLLRGRLSAVAPRERRHPDFPLRHFVRCGYCDRPLTASWSKGRNGYYAYYRCQNRSCKAVNESREKIERGFVTYLQQFQAKPEYIRLFGEIIIDLWKEKREQALALHRTAQKRLSRLLECKQQLVEVFVYRREIDSATYQQQFDKLGEELAIAEIEERDARIEELDIQAAVEFGQYVLLNASRLWVEASFDQKQRLQDVLFPRGVQFKDGEYRTAETSMIFYHLESKPDKKEVLVALPGIEPGFED